MIRNRIEKRPKAKPGMTLDKLALMMGRGFNAVDKKFEDIGRKFESIDGKFDGVNERLDKVDAGLLVLERDSKEIKHEMAAMKASIRELVDTLDAFLKRRTDHEEEFELLKREMKFVKKILKEKLHVDLEREMPRSVGRAESFFAPKGLGGRSRVWISRLGLSAELREGDCQSRAATLGNESIFSAMGALRVSAPGTPGILKRGTRSSLPISAPSSPGW